MKDDEFQVEGAEVKPFVDMFEEAEQSGLDMRDTAHRCRDYVDGNQLTAEEISELQKRGQPVIVINRIRRKVNWLKGIEIKSRTSPRAFHRNPTSEEDAEAATFAVRYVCDNTNWRRKRSKVWEDMLVEGVGGVEVVHEFRPPMAEPEIKINRYSYDRLFWDPHSAEDDFSDARYLGAVIWSDMAEVMREYPEKKDIIEASMGPVDTEDTYEDKPYYRVWSDPKRRRVRCVLVYYVKGGVWHWAKFVKGGILEEGTSPYEDDMGMSICPMILQATYTSRDNMRYGVVKDMLDPQDEINKRRSKLLHQLTSRQTWGIKGAVKSVSGLKRELAKPDGHIEIEGEAVDRAAEAGIAPFNIISQQDQIAGQSALLAESKAEIDLLGANSALQGLGEATSGREVMARQQGGMIEISGEQDALAWLTLRVYRHIWFAVRQFWRAEKWIRVTDDEKNMKFVGLNRPIPMHEKMAQMPREQVVAVARDMGLYPGDPRLQMPVAIENDVSRLDVDIVFEEVDEQITLAGETFDNLVKLATSQPGAVPTEILIEAAPNLPTEIKKKLIAAIEQRNQQQGEMTQRGMQMQEAVTQAEIQETQAGAMEDFAQAMRHRAEAQRALMAPAAGE